MNLINFVKSMGYGVLHNTQFANITDYNDPEQMMPIVTLIEEGLTRLYSRFNLRERHVIVEMQVGVTFYHFEKLYTVQNGDRIRVPYPYIMDLPNDPFEEDLIKVLRVDDSFGNRRPIDDHNRIDSVFMVQFNVMHNPYPRYLEALYVTYQAKHVPLAVVDNETGDVFLEEEILLPPVLEPALSNYVAYMVYSRINTQEAVTKAMGHMAVYNQIIQDVENYDLVNSSSSNTNARFDIGGWA